MSKLYVLVDTDKKLFRDAVFGSVTTLEELNENEQDWTRVFVLKREMAEKTWVEDKEDA